MGNEQVIRDLVDERDAKYGKAWLVTGRLMSIINTKLLMGRGLFFAWVMILNKLVRATATPDDPDHWKDIAGYALLVVDYLEGKNEPS